MEPPSTATAATLASQDTNPFSEPSQPSTEATTATSGQGRTITGTEALPKKADPVDCEYALALAHLGRTKKYGPDCDQCHQASVRPVRFANGAIEECRAFYECGHTCAHTYCVTCVATRQGWKLAQATEEPTPGGDEDKEDDDVKEEVKEEVQEDANEGVEEAQDLTTEDILDLTSTPPPKKKSGTKRRKRSKGGKGKEPASDDNDSPRRSKRLRTKANREAKKKADKEAASAAAAQRMAERAAAAAKRSKARKARREQARAMETIEEESDDDDEMSEDAPGTPKRNRRKRVAHFTPEQKRRQRQRVSADFEESPAQNDKNTNHAGGETQSPLRPSPHTRPKQPKAWQTMANPLNEPPAPNTALKTLTLRKQKSEQAKAALISAAASAKQQIRSGELAKRPRNDIFKYLLYLATLMSRIAFDAIPPMEVPLFEIDAMTEGLVSELYTEVLRLPKSAMPYYPTAPATETQTSTYTGKATPISLMSSEKENDTFRARMAAQMAALEKKNETARASQKAALEKMRRELSGKRKKPEKKSEEKGPNNALSDAELLRMTARVSRRRRRHEKQRRVVSDSDSEEESGSTSASGSENERPSTIQRARKNIERAREKERKKVTREARPTDGLQAVLLAVMRQKNAPQLATPMHRKLQYFLQGRGVKQIILKLSPDSTDIPGPLVEECVRWIHMNRVRELGAKIDLVRGIITAHRKKREEIPKKTADLLTRLRTKRTTTLLNMAAMLEDLFVHMRHAPHDPIKDLVVHLIDSDFDKPDTFYAQYLIHFRQVQFVMREPYSDTVSVPAMLQERAAELGADICREMFAFGYCSVGHTCQKHHPFCGGCLNPRPHPPCDPLRRKAAAPKPKPKQTHPPHYDHIRGRQRRGRGRARGRGRRGKGRRR